MDSPPKSEVNDGRRVGQPRTDDTPRYEHVHADGIHHKTDRTIPFLSSESPSTLISGAPTLALKYP